MPQNLSFRANSESGPNKNYIGLNTQNIICTWGNLIGEISKSFCS